MTTRVVLEVRCDEQEGELAEAIRWVSSLPETSSAKHECLAFIHTMMTRKHWAEADRYREYERQAEIRLACRKGKEEKGC